MRDLTSKAYRKFRSDVLRRDGHRCRFPGCQARRRLKVHHIRRFADAPELERNRLNGISLCQRHHVQVTSREEDYVGLFQSVVGGSDVLIDHVWRRANEKND